MAGYFRYVVSYLCSASAEDLDRQTIGLIVPFSRCCKSSYQTWTIQSSFFRVIWTVEFGNTSSEGEISASSVRSSTGFRCRWENQMLLTDLSHSLLFSKAASLAKFWTPRPKTLQNPKKDWRSMSLVGARNPRTVSVVCEAICRSLGRIIYFK